MIDTGEVEILLVEDSPTDGERTILALRANNLANRLFWVKDGAEAPDVVFGQGAYSDRDVAESYRLGVNSYISKPVEFDTFSNTVIDLGCYWLLTNRAPVTQ